MARALLFRPSPNRTRSGPSALGQRLDDADVLLLTALPGPSGAAASEES